MDRDPLPSPKQCSIPPFLFSCLGHNFPLSSDFSHPFPMSRPTTPRTRRPNVTNHIIQSHLRSQDPRPSSTRILLCLLASTLNSPRFFHLTSLSPPPARSVLSALKLSPIMCSTHCQSPPPLTCHAFFRPLYGYVGQVKPGPPR